MAEELVSYIGMAEYDFKLMDTWLPLYAHFLNSLVAYRFKCWHIAGVLILLRCQVMCRINTFSVYLVKTCQCQASLGTVGGTATMFNVFTSYYILPWPVIESLLKDSLTSLCFLIEHKKIWYLTVDSDLNWGCCSIYSEYMCDTPHHSFWVWV